MEARIIIIIFCWVFIFVAAYMVSNENAKRDKKLLWLGTLAVILAGLCLVDILGKEWIHILIGNIIITIGVCTRKLIEFRKLLRGPKSYGSYY